MTNIINIKTIQTCICREGISVSKHEAGTLLPRIAGLFVSNPTRLFSTSVHYLESLSTDVRSYISETNIEPIQRLGFFCVSKSYFWAKKMAQNAYSKRMLAWTWTLLWLLCGVIIINGTTWRLSVSFGEDLCGILSFVFVLVNLNHGIDSASIITKYSRVGQ